MNREFRLHWKNYVFQSVLATLTLFFAFWVLKMENVVIVAAIGATAFIVFAMPNSLTAKPRNVIGGHLAGLGCGALCGLLTCQSSMCSIIAYSVAVGLSIFIMVVTDTEHPPASGTALGIAISGCSWEAAVAVITSVVVLSSAHRLLRPYLRDLT